MKTLRFLIIRICPIVALMLIASHDSSLNAQVSTVTKAVAMNTAAQNLARWKAMTEEQRQAIMQTERRLTSQKISELQSTLARFNQMTEAEQTRIRQNYERFKQMIPAQQEELKNRYLQYKSRKGAL